MSIDSIVGTALFKWLILPLLIFLARVLDVSLGTLRIVFVSRGMKYLAPIIGFFEVIIWLLAIRVIMQNLSNYMCYIAYGAGFAMGTYLGIYLERRLAVGRAILRIITIADASDLIKTLRAKKYGVTQIDANGSEGKVNVIFMIIRRCDYNGVIQIIKKFNPKAFYSLEDVRFVSEGIFLEKLSPFYKGHMGLFKYFRKGK
ncbi:DUF2179 domain-containing protein [Acidobacteriota bacterium]